MAQLKTLKFNDNVVAKSNGSYFSDAPLVFQENGTDARTSLSPAGLVTNGNVEVTSESGHILVKDDSCGNTTSWIAMSGYPGVGGRVGINNGHGATVVSLEANCGYGCISLGNSCGNTMVQATPTGMFFHDSCGRDALSFTVQSGFHMEFGTGGGNTPLVIEGSTTYSGGFEMRYGDDPSQTICGEYSRFQMYGHTIQLETQLCGDYSSIRLQQDRLMISGGAIIYNHKQLQFNNDGTVTWTQA